MTEAAGLAIEEKPVTATSDHALTMSERIRQYIVEYPNMKAKGICQALHIEYRKHGSLARKIMFQERHRYRSLAHVWDVTRGLGPRPDLCLHRTVFESRGVPGWLADLVMSKGGEFDWRRVEAGNLVYYLREFPHFGQVRLFPKSGKLLVYARGELTQERLVKFEAIVTSLCREMAGGILDRSQHGKLQIFLERLLAFGASQHVAIPISGMKMVRRFKARLPDRGVVVRKDNSHPSCLEFEFNVPTPVTELAEAIEKQSVVLAGFTQQIELHLSALQGINDAVKALTTAANDLKNAVKSSG